MWPMYLYRTMPRKVHCHKYAIIRNCRKRHLHLEVTPSKLHLEIHYYCLLNMDSCGYVVSGIG